MFVYNQMWNPPYSVMRTGSPVPTVPELYKIYSIIRMLVCHICAPPPVDPKTRYYIGTVAHCANLCHHCMKRSENTVFVCSTAAA